MEATSAVASGTTYRFHTRRLTQIDPFVYVLLDFFMGGRGDRPITDWDEMFLPMLLRDHLRNVEVSRVRRSESSARSPDPSRSSSSQSTRMSRRSRRRFSGSSRRRGSSWPGWWQGWRCLPRTGGVPGWLGKLGFLAVGGLWSFAAGVAGTIMIVSHLTDHEFMYWNENFLQTNPVSLALLVVAAGGGARKEGSILLANRLAILAAAAAGLGFVLQALPGLDQVNGYYVVGRPSDAHRDSVGARSAERGPMTPRDEQAKAEYDH